MFGHASASGMRVKAPRQTNIQRKQSTDSYYEKKRQDEKSPDEQDTRRARVIILRWGVYEALEHFGLEQTSCGIDCWQAAKNGGFSRYLIDNVDSFWPFDEKYSEAVKMNNVITATLRLITLERRMAREANTMLDKNR